MSLVYPDVSISNVENGWFVLIDVTVKHIADELNQHLKRNFELDEDVVVVSSLLEQDGSIPSHVNNKVVASVVHIQKDTMPHRSQQSSGASSNRSVVHAQPVFFNVYVMFSAYFGGSNYQEGLKFISSTIGYFQSQPIFDRSNSPGIPDGIDKLILDIENLSINDLSNLWGVLGGKYLPSILYRVRMVAFDSNAIVRQDHVASKPEPSVGSI